MFSFSSLRASVALIATVVGVGVFALPYAFAQSGVLVGLLHLALLGGCQLTLLRFYAELTERIPGKHRFGGYMEKVLGSKIGAISSVLMIASFMGSLLVFTILGGRFFASLTGLSFLPAAACVAGVVALMTFGGLGRLARLSTCAVAGILTLYAVLIAFTLPAFSWQNMLTLPRSFSDAVLPYGVIFFALAGLGAIPEMHDLLRGRVKNLRRILTRTFCLIVLFYAFFALVVVGASGGATTPDALTGLAPVLPPLLLRLGSVLGLLSVVSIQSMVGVECMAALSFDARVPWRASWLMVIASPLVVVFLGVRSFVDVIGFVGSVLAGLIGLLVIFAHERLTPSRYRVIPWILGAVLFLGILSGL